MIAAPSSGGGKTLLTCGLLKIAQDRGKVCAAFKCGPDYIDSLFHRKLVKEKRGNLDLFFTDESTTRSLLGTRARGSDISVIEGVMGYYDGMHPSGVDASSYDIARVTDTPVVLVIDAQGASLSLAAEIKGFAEFQQNSRIAGVVLNRCKESVYQYVAPHLEKHTGIPLLGYIPPDERFALESRHLGLVTAEELEGELISSWVEVLAQTLDVDGLFKIAASVPPLDFDLYEQPRVSSGQLRMAVAHDVAFQFYYQENLNMLKDMGVDLVEFSPMHDKALPLNVHGVYLGGGYPELHADHLEKNQSIKTSLKRAISRGLPTIAECGGFLYLLDTLEDTQGQTRLMTGVLSGNAENAHRLQHFGYASFEAKHDCLYGKKGLHIRGHEFHYWQASHEGDAFMAHKPHRKQEWPCIIAKDNLIAGFPHLYFPSNPDCAKQLVLAMQAYQKEQV